MESIWEGLNNYFVKNYTDEAIKEYSSTQKIRERAEVKKQILLLHGYCDSCIHLGLDASGPGQVMTCTHEKAQDFGYIVHWFSNDAGEYKRTPVLGKCPIY